jgi:site-specific recombinase XerD
MFFTLTFVREGRSHSCEVEVATVRVVARRFFTRKILVVKAGIQSAEFRTWIQEYFSTEKFPGHTSARQPPVLRKCTHTFSPAREDDRKKTNSMTTKIDQLKLQYLEYIEIEKGRAIRTVENYAHYLDVFLKQTQIKNPEDLTNTKLREFRVWLNRQSAGNNAKSGETMKKKTQNYYLIAVRSFLKYLTKIGIPSLAADQIELAKVPERQIDIITTDELKRLLDAPNKEKDPQKKARGLAILELLFSTGLRVSELCSLNSDLDLTRDELSIRGKGGKVRVVFLSDEAKDKVKKYLALRKDMSDALFVKVGNEKTKLGDIKKDKDEEPTEGLTRRSIERIVKRYATMAGISSKVTPHTIRHLFATDLLSNGADLRSVQALLGHANINTTQIYTHVTDKHLRDVHKKFHNKPE